MNSYGKIKVIEPGLHSSIQEYPGRIGFRSFGIPASGPMDFFAFNLGNRLLGNPQHAAGLECVYIGPTLWFMCKTRIVIAGPSVKAYVNGLPVEPWTVLDIRNGDILYFERAPKACLRLYILISGGFESSTYMGSRSTFSLRELNHIRPLEKNDILRVPLCSQWALPAINLASAFRHYYSKADVLHVLPGPYRPGKHFTDHFYRKFLDSHWYVDSKSDRSGIRLSGPRIAWQSNDDGEAGLHLSNVHDMPYLTGVINIAGDTPIIIGPDGPTIGGYFCIAIVIQADLWKLGQLRPGQRIRFIQTRIEDAERKTRNIENLILDKTSADRSYSYYMNTLPEPVIYDSERGSRIEMHNYGEDGLLIRAMSSAFELPDRIIINEICDHLLTGNDRNIEDVSYGTASAYFKFRHGSAATDDVVASINSCAKRFNYDTVIKTRILKLPLAWDDESTRHAVKRYGDYICLNAPWMPSNIEYLCRINNLNDADELREIIFDSTYMVLGLGDVYFGAPVAVPIDPRHRLFSTKYMPPRTWTPAGAVGVGGMNLCIYSCDSPGGYQLIGRTLPVWDFSDPGQNADRAGLFNNLDIIRFFPASETEIEYLSQYCHGGSWPVHIEDYYFHLADHMKFLQRNRDDIYDTLENRRATFLKERIRLIENS